MRCWYAFGVAAPLAAPITPQTAQTVTVTRRRDLGLSSRRTSAGPYHRAAETGVFVMLASMRLCALFGLFSGCARPGRLLPSRPCDAPQVLGSAWFVAPPDGDFSYQVENPPHTGSCVRSRTRFRHRLCGDRRAGT